MGRGMVYPLCILPLLSNLLAKAIPLQMHAPPGRPNPLSGRSGVGRFFRYTAYTISYNGGYSSFLDLSHGIKSYRKGVRKSRPRTGRVQGHTPWTQPCAFDKSLRQSYNDHSTGRQKACRGRQKPHWEVPEEPKAGPCRICFFGTLCRQGTCRKGHRERKEDAAPCFCAIPVG